MYPEEQYKLKPLSPAQLVRKPLRIMVPLGVLLYLQGYAFPLYLNHPDAFGIANHLPAIAIPIAVYLLMATTRSIRKNDTFLLTIDEDFITSTQSPGQPQRISRSKVSSIVRTKSGTLYIRGDRADKLIIVPPGILEEAALMNTLASIKPITDVSGIPIAALFSQPKKP